VDRLQCIIGGHERGGTTLFIEILKNHPLINGGFECGMLMWDSPINFINSGIYWDIFKRTWCNSDQAQAIKVCSTKSFNESCNLLHQLRAYPEDVKLFYKCPAYMRHLDQVLARCSSPSIIVSRDPRGLFWSRCKHQDILPGDLGIDEFCNRYNDYANSLELALRKYKERILIVRFEDFCEAPHYWGDIVFNYLGLDFKRSYVDGFTNNRKSYSVHGESIDKSYCYEWKNQLSSHQIDRILKNTIEHKQFWIDPS